MRQATIVIRWAGPDKKVRGLIEDHVEQLFMDDAFMGAVAYADSTVRFVPRIPPAPSPPRG